MTQVLLRKEFGSLRPASDEAYRVLGNIKSGTSLVVDVKDPRRRSVKRHNFWFQIVDLMYGSQEIIKRLYEDNEDFRKCLLIRLGRCNYYPQKTGEPVPVAKSVSFAKMTEEEMGRLVDDTLQFAQDEMGFDRANLEAEARNLAGLLK